MNHITKIILVQRKIIKVYVDSVDEDSEQLPTLLTVENFKCLVDNLKELLNITEDKPVNLILDKARVLDILMISHDSSYVVSSKSKPNVIKIYMNSSV